MTADTYLEAALQRSREYDSTLPYLIAARDRSRSHLMQTGLPAPKTELWKYSNPRDFLLSSAEQETTATGTTSTPQTWSGGHQIVDSEPSSFLQDHPEGLSVYPFAELPESLKKRVSETVGSINPPESRATMGHLNMGSIENGLLLHVAAGARINPIINLRTVVSGFSRVLILLEENAAMHLVEQSQITAARHLVLESKLGDRSHLQHTRIQPDTQIAEYSMCATQLSADATYEMNLYTLGGFRRRNEVYIQHAGEHSESSVRGALFAKNKSRIDTQIMVHHCAANTQSRQLVRGLCANTAQLSFNGKIQIDPGAQQVDAQLSNKNLLLDNTARINTRPELEIYADQVKCAHGATVGEMDENEVFYLRTRGIPTAIARQMIARGFIRSCLTETDYRDYLESQYKLLFNQWALQ